MHGTRRVLRPVRFNDGEQLIRSERLGEVGIETGC
jgi:hypothetical protein